MRWAWTIGRFQGIRINLHVTLLLLLGWVGLMSYASTQQAASALVGIGYAVIVFAIVVLHELGHAVAARAFGIPTRNITLYPMGGIAELERMPTNPFQELVIALAGPAVNVVLAVGSLMLFGLSASVQLLFTSNPLATAPLWSLLFWTNVILALFNLLPAFPMDGGRVLRAALAMRGDYVGATRTATKVARVMAVGFCVAAVFVNPFLLLVAWVVWRGSEQELKLAEMRYTPYGGVFDRVTWPNVTSWDDRSNAARTSGGWQPPGRVTWVVWRG